MASPWNIGNVGFRNGPAALTVDDIARVGAGRSRGKRPSPALLLILLIIETIWSPFRFEVFFRSIAHKIFTARARPLTPLTGLFQRLSEGSAWREAPEGPPGAFSSSSRSMAGVISSSLFCLKDGAAHWSLGLKIYKVFGVEEEASGVSVPIVRGARFLANNFDNLWEGGKP